MANKIKTISLRDWCAKVNRSNGQHMRLWRKAVKENNVKQARYHGEVCKRQNERCDLLSKSEKRSIYKKV